MSMSILVVGFIPPDETWVKMKAIWDACREGGVEVPAAVERFFGGTPDEAGQTVEIPAREWRGGDAEGVEVTLAELPPQVKVIRFYAAW